MIFLCTNVDKPKQNRKENLCRKQKIKPRSYALDFGDFIFQENSIKDEDELFLEQIDQKIQSLVIKASFIESKISEFDTITANDNGKNYVLIDPSIAPIS